MTGAQLSSLTMTLKPSTKKDFARQTRSLGPNLQGVLMEHIDGSYAALLHQLPFNPYSQYCVWEDDALVWRVNALTSEASAHVIEPLRSLETVAVKGIDTTFDVSKMTIDS